MMMNGRASADWGAFFLRALSVLALALFISPANHSDTPASDADVAAQELAQVAVILIAAQDYTARITLPDHDVPSAAIPALAGQPLQVAAFALQCSVQAASLSAFSVDILPPSRGPPVA
jgi:hypothetical protein